MTTVSQGAYSIWPLLTYLSHGVTGLQRVYTQSANSLVGPLSYQHAGQLLTGLALLLVMAALLVRSRRSLDSGGYLPLVTLGMTAFLMLLTGIVSTHFLLALPLFVLLWRWTRGPAYWFIVIAWSVTTFVTMYGDMGVILSAHDYPLLAPANNPVTKFFVQLYTSDRFINVGTVATICALAWLAWLTLRPPHPAEQPISKPAVSQ